MLKLVLLKEFIIYIENGPPGIAKYIFDLFFVETLNYNFSTG
jgi:hypothetical protein